MAAIARNDVTIYIVASGTDASALQATDKIEGQIKSYAKTGGETETESDPVFGGYVDKEKPQTQFEVEFEIVPSFEQGYRWEEMVYGSITVTTDEGAVAGDFYVAGKSVSDRAVFIEADNGTGEVDGWGFNNCNVTVLDMEHNADDNQTKTLTLKFGPTDESGISNFVYGSYNIATSFSSVTDLPNWSALDTT